MIATPAYDGTVDVRYADALVQTIRMATQQGVQVLPVFLPGDALVQRARNSLCEMALEAFEGKGVDDVVFIDADMYWMPAGFFRLLSHDLDIVGGLCRQAADPQVLAFRPKKGCSPDKDGILEVAGTGAAFLRIRRTALQRLWKRAQPYRDSSVEVRSVFEVTIEGRELCSEDVAMCHKWAAMRGQVYVDLQVQVGHVGRKCYEIEGPRKEEAKA